MGVEPTSPAWEAGVMTVIRRPRQTPWPILYDFVTGLRSYRDATREEDRCPEPHLPHHYFKPSRFEFNPTMPGVT
jgi:hypothetical protein